MRLWSIHPQYLDAKGLVALWRETLLAKNVLQGNTRGYKNHPQLKRFQALSSPVDAIMQYLSEVYTEATARGYQFDASKFTLPSNTIIIPVTAGQVAYERQHLLTKLQLRAPEHYEKLKHLKQFHTHPQFTIVPGDVEDWEIV